MRGRGTMQNINFEEMPTTFHFYHKDDTDIKYLANFNEAAQGFDVSWGESNSNRTFYDYETTKELLEAGSWVIGNPVTKPDHYHQNGIDVIGFSKMQFSKEEVRGFMRINILKYATRYHRKNGVEDLKKMIEYAEQLIELEESK
jgi:Protein of unknwon function (DUF3310)